jgi:hypothetical protein
MRYQWRQGRVSSYVCSRANISAKSKLKGQCHDMVVEFRPWINSIGLD